MGPERDPQLLSVAGIVCERVTKVIARDQPKIKLPRRHEWQCDGGSEALGDQGCDWLSHCASHLQPCLVVGQGLGAPTKRGTRVWPPPPQLAVPVG